MKTSSAMVLDLDSTLIYTVDDTNKAERSMIVDMYNADNNSVYKLRLGRDSMLGVYRPYLTEFLTYCRQAFDKLIVYTAGTEDYGAAIVSVIEKKTGIAFDEVYARKSCLVIDDNLLHTEDTMRKPLELVLPHIDIRRMMIVDDKMCNFRFNPRNGILIPAFSPQSIEEAVSDNYLLQLMKWLNTVEVKTIDDYRLLNKDNIFDVDIAIDLY